MTTVKELIENLAQLDPNELILFEYYTKDNFSHIGRLGGNDVPFTDAEWVEVAESNDNILCNQDAYNDIESALFTKIETRGK